MRISIPGLAEAAKVAGQILPEGKYETDIMFSEVKESANGNQYLNLKLVVNTDDPELLKWNGKQIYHIIMLSHVDRLAKLLSTLKITLEGDDFDEKMLIGYRLGVFTSIEASEGYDPKPKVTGMFSIDQANF